MSVISVHKDGRHKRIVCTTGEGDGMLTWTNTYGLTELPAWRANEKRRGEHGQLLDDPKPGQSALWSGSGEYEQPPKIGDRVYVVMNGFGWSKVIAYLVEYGWLGIEAVPENPPAWYVKQRKEQDAEDRKAGKDPREYEPMFFGAELGPEKEKAAS